MKLRAYVVIGCLAAALGGCDRGFDLRVELPDGGNRVSMAAFRKGVFFGETPITFCPKRLFVEELTRDGPKGLVRMRLRDAPCEPHHRWSMPLLSADGRPLLEAYPGRSIAITVVTEQNEVGGTDWITLPS